MNRRLKVVLVALPVVVVAAAGGFILKVKASMRGPAPPVCRAPELARRTFGPPRQISAPGKGTYDIEPSAALLPDGDLVAIYNTRTGLFGDSWLESVLLTRDGKVTTTPLPRVKSQYFDVWLADGADGVVRAVWLGHNGGRPERDMEVGYSETTDGVHWTPGRPVEDDAQDCPGAMRGCMDKPMIVTAGGATLVFYYSEAKGGLRVRRSVDQGRTFAPSTAIENGDAYANVAVGASGAVYVVSQTGKPGATGHPDRYGDARNDVELVVGDHQGNFGKPARVSADDDVVPFFFSNPGVAVDEPRGALYVVYPAGPDHRWDLWLATSRDRGASWSRVKVNDDAPCASHMAPQVALDGATGVVHVTWLENRSGAGRLVYAACAPGGATCGGNEAVSEPFASFTFARHSPDWLGEYGTLRVDRAGERGVLHSVWTQTVDEGGTPTARIFHAEAALAR